MFTPSVGRIYDPIVRKNPLLAQTSESLPGTKGGLRLPWLWVWFGFQFGVGAIGLFNLGLGPRAESYDRYDFCGFRVYLARLFEFLCGLGLLGPALMESLVLFVI